MKLAAYFSFFMCPQYFAISTCSSHITVFTEPQFTTLKSSSIAFLISFASVFSFGGFNALCQQFLPECLIHFFFILGSSSNTFYKKGSCESHFLSSRY